MGRVFKRRGQEDGESEGNDNNNVGGGPPTEPEPPKKDEEETEDEVKDSLSSTAKDKDGGPEGEEDDPLEKVKEFFGFKKDGEETENPIEQIKALGIAGAISYALWEGAFWTVGGAGAIVAYFFAFGHWPDFNDSEDMQKLGAEAFAFVNLARFIVPLRIGLAVGTAPWVDENIV